MTAARFLARCVVALIVAAGHQAVFPTPAYAHRECLAPHQAKDGYVAVVDLSDLCLHVAGGYSFPISGPAKSSFTPKGAAVVRAVLFDPVWYPTQETIEAYEAKNGTRLPKRVGPYSTDTRNAMGVLKVVLHFSAHNGAQTFRIHGTNRPASIGRRESRGCIRLHNDHALIVGHWLQVLLEQVGEGRVQIWFQD